MILSESYGEGKRVYKLYDPDIQSRAEARAKAEKIYHKLSNRGHDYDKVVVQGSHIGDKA